jgi:hypothetical protein
MRARDPPQVVGRFAFRGPPPKGKGELKMSSKTDVQINVKFRQEDDYRDTLGALAKAEDRSVQSLLRVLIIEGLKARLRTDRIPARV